MGRAGGRHRAGKPQDILYQRFTAENIRYAK
jgi:hypothetical protein